MIGEVLEQRHQELDVKLLLFSIQRSRLFEEQLSKRYTGVTITGEKENKPAVESTNPFEDESETGSQSEISDSRLDDKLEAQKANPFNKLITGSFTPYLSIYVKSQEKALSDLLNRFVADFGKERYIFLRIINSYYLKFQNSNIFRSQKFGGKEKWLNF